MYMHHEQQVNASRKGYFMLLETAVSQHSQQPLDTLKLLGVIRNYNNSKQTWIGAATSAGRRRVGRLVPAKAILPA